MLQMAALYETGDLITPDLLDDEIVKALGELAATASDRRRMAEPAQRLVDRYRALP